MNLTLVLARARTLALAAGGSGMWIIHVSLFKAFEAGQSAVAGSEVIGRELEMGETMMLGLRLVEGVSLAHFESRFGVKFVGYLCGGIERARQTRAD